MLLTQFSRAVPETFQRGIVTCVKCDSPIALRRLEALAEEFTLCCSRCHHRAFYSKRMLALDAVPERRKKSRR